MIDADHLARSSRTYDPVSLLCNETGTQFHGAHSGDHAGEMGTQRQHSVQHRAGWKRIRVSETQWKVGQGGEGLLDLMRGRSRITIDRRIPKIPRGGTSGFQRPGRHCLPAPGAKCRGSHEGRAVSY